MTSVRTTYRNKRIELIKENILLLSDMLTMNKQDLEKISLVSFKKLSKLLKREDNKTIIFSHGF
jgi:putative protein kinase ArgK-like GTPase of G3E family